MKYVYSKGKWNIRLYKLQRDIPPQSKKHDIKEMISNLS